MAKSVRFLGRRVPVPSNVFLRIGFGVLCIIGGFLWFLPVLGLWMLPLGFLILSIDLPPVRRFRRRMDVTFGQIIRKRFPWLARKFGWTS
jgi:membrane protein implicated in regulation of membrane protease activity